MMKLRKARRRPNKSRGTRYETAFKIEAIRIFETALEKGELGKEIVKRLGVSIATINRWRRERERLESFSKLQQINGGQIDRAIEILLSENDDNQLRIEAFFNLAIWQRWPTTPDMHAPAMLPLFLKYFDPNGSWKSFADIDEKNLQLILRNTSTKFLARLCSDQERTNDYLRFPELHMKNYNDRDFLAEVVSFLLSDRNAIGAQKSKMSLKRAHFASQNQLFRVHYAQSEKTFSTLWHSLGAAAAFYYVEKYHSPVELELDPWSENFRSDVDTMLADPAVMKTYLAQVKFIVETLQDRLDPRARSALVFPTFPVTLASQAVKPTPFAKDLTVIMRNY